MTITTISERYEAVCGIIHALCEGKSNDALAARVINNVGRYCCDEKGTAWESDNEFQKERAMYEFLRFIDEEEFLEAAFSSKRGVGKGTVEILKSVLLIMNWEGI